MSKFPALITFFSIFFFGFYSNALTLESAAVMPTATPTPDSPIENISIELDKDTASPECPLGYRPLGRRTCGDGMLIVVTVAAKSENNALDYKYSISGGRIIGEGAKVSWDLTGGQPGTYIIKVDVKDKAKMQSWTETKTVTVCEDYCQGDCFCPEISVDAPKAAIQPGEVMVFIVNVSGWGGTDEVVYNWTVSKGKIIDGQGTPVIIVVTDSKMAGSMVKATINFGGNAFCGGVCVQTFSAEGFVAAKKRQKK